ncbi:hypothetical protein ACFXPA_11755 [Amycolatopsis sp. NPDC059090]|uniref:hypothetical protein n=1 Tax=unclassified Amycolatopsis TaxID=2618356 RepID=UPI003672AC78
MADSRNYSEATKAALFALSVSCYEPECQQPTVTVFVDDPDKNVQIAHIRALNPTGPRYNPPGHPTMAPAARNAFPNLILLCPRHHRLVDNPANQHLYTVDLLHDWKKKAERDIRTKVDGLDRLTEERLDAMLTNAARNTRDEIDQAIAEFTEASGAAAELLRALFDKIERHYLDAESIARLSDAAHQLTHLQDTAGLLYHAAGKLGNFEDNVGILSQTAKSLGELEGTASQLQAAASGFYEQDVSGSSRRLTKFIADYSAIPDPAASIESASASLVARIEHQVKRVETATPPIVVDDQQRWKWGLWGFALGVVIVFLTVAIWTSTHKP